jgi:hypothetical protein
LTKSSQAISKGFTRDQITCSSVWQPVLPMMMRWQMSLSTQLRPSVLTTSDRQLSSPTSTRDLDLTVSMVIFLLKICHLEKKWCRRLLTHLTEHKYLNIWE